MARFRFPRRLILSCLLVGLLAPSASAFEPFVVEDIRVEGLQRIEEGTVFNYMDAGVGDRMTGRRAAAVIRSLYRTDFFSDVELLREGRTLVIRVRERPTIASFEIAGNQELKTEDLVEGLEGVGLSEGRVFNRSLLDQVEQELRRQYFGNGRYGVQIDTEVEELEDNRVAVSIQIDEGSVATIRQINIVGNESFSDEQLRGELTLKPAGLSTVLSSRDRYSREELSGDLEALASFYQDRGYINFRIESTQVSLSPEKDDIYITIGIEEGRRYTVSDVGMAGDMILDEEELRPMIPIAAGDVFSRQTAQQSAERITDRLGNEGYAFAEVNPVPEIDEDDQTVSLTFMLNPGRRVYVRHIEFTGNDKTRDDVLRREMRQFESGYFNSASVTRGRTRLTRLPFVEEAEVETERVSGSDDLVDVSYDITERSAGSFQVGIGYSGSQGAILNASISHSNFLGSGKRVSLEANNSEFADIFSFSLTEPFYTENGVSRTISLFSRRTSALTNVSSDFTVDTYGGTLRYGIPITEFDSIRLGASYRFSKLSTTPVSPREVIDFIDDNGAEVDSFELETGWVRDTRNRTIFPDRGYLHRVLASATVPPGDLEFVLGSYRYLQMVPMNRHLLGQMEIDLGYAEAYGETTDIPPFEKLFAGGINTVRGFDSSSLGPKDQFDNPVGGNVRISSQNELIFPSLIKSRNMQLSVFFDAGNVYADADEVEFDTLRTSAGLSFRWLTPVVGLMKFSLASPINEAPRDDTETFSFTFGRTF